MKRRIFSMMVAAGMGLMALPLMSGASPQDHWDQVATWTGADWTGTQPRGMALGTNGLVYIALEGAGEIRVVETNGTIVTNWSGFSGPQDVAVATNGLVYVCDTGNNRIKVFDQAGNAVTSWGGAGTNDSEFNAPSTVSILRSGNLVVADSGNRRIQIFDPMGGFIRKWGEEGTLAGQFNDVIEAEVGVDDLIYVIEPVWAESRVQKFDELGGYANTYYCAMGTSISRGLRDLFYLSSCIPGSWGFGPRDPVSGDLLDILSRTDDDRGAVHVLEIQTGILLVSFSGSGSVSVYRRYYRQSAYNPDVSNNVPVPVVFKAEQRPGTAWMDVDYVVYDGNDTNVTVAALAFVDGRSDFGSIIKVSTLAENTGTNLGPGIASGVEHHLTWDVAADWNTNYANVQIEILAHDQRDLLDMHLVTIPAVGTNAELTINQSMISDADLANTWTWWVATNDPAIGLVSGSVVGVSAPYAGVTLATRDGTTAAGRAFLFQRLGGVEASAEEKQRALDARAIAIEEDPDAEQSYWFKPIP